MARLDARQPCCDRLLRHDAFHGAQQHGPLSVASEPVHHRACGRERRRECAQGGPIKVPDLRGLEWVRVLPDPQQHQSGLWMLDAGERATLELALERHAELVLIDERIGRNVAEYLGLRITGTLGVLLKARQQRLILSFRDEVAAMRREGIHYHPRLIDRLAPMVGE